jgi:hypothetical protein
MLELLQSERRVVKYRCPNRRCKAVAVDSRSLFDEIDDFLPGTIEKSKVFPSLDGFSRTRYTGRHG